MEALNNLVNKGPDWLHRLDDLIGQINRRQTELAAITSANAKNSETKVHTSCTGVKRKYDNAHISYILSFSGWVMWWIELGRNLMRKAKMNDDEFPLLRYAVGTKSHPSSKSQFGARDQSAAIRESVFYDGFVQNILYELVRFVSSCGNLIREAKKHAKLAQIKKLAEQSMSEDGNNGDGLPSLRYMSSRRVGAGDQPSDVFDELNEGLKFINSTCEDVALQLLKGEECEDKIRKVRERLAKIVEIAKEEKERVQPRIQWRPWRWIQTSWKLARALMSVEDSQAPISTDSGYEKPWALSVLSLRCDHAESRVSSYIVGLCEFLLWMLLLLSMCFFWAVTSNESLCMKRT